MKSLYWGFTTAISVIAMWLFAPIFFVASLIVIFGEWFGDRVARRCEAARVIAAHDELRGKRSLLGVAGWAILSVFALAGCVDTINPVRYQPVEVLVTKPCLAGRNPPPEAQTRIAVSCDGKDCTLKCSDTRPEECAKHMAADIIELQREARESRSLIKECSK